MSGTSTIIRLPGKLRIVVTDDVHIVMATHHHQKIEVFTIQDTEEDRDTEIDFWATDIDLLIDALLDAKREIKNRND